MSELDLILFILKQVCLGSLISGIIIFLLTLFFQGSHLFDHDADLNHDIGHDVSLDHGVMDIGHADLDMHADIDFNVDTDVSIGIDKDIHIGIDKDTSILDHGIGDDTPTPLMLLLGTFMISFGGSGTILLNSTIHPFLSVLIIITLPIGVTLAVSKLWSKIAVSEIYDTALETIQVDDVVKTLTTVDTEGGLVVIETSSIHGPIKMAAKTRYGAISKGMAAYVIEVQGNTLIIDEWPSKEEQDKPIPEGTIKWE
ncbi:MAG: NfeD family protein [Candidatus Hodarchaeota archaeon]